MEGVVVGGGGAKAVGARGEGRDGGVEEGGEDGEKQDGVEPSVGESCFSKCLGGL